VSDWETIGWWELRRIPYNIVVGCAGLVTCVITGAGALASELLFHADFGLPDPPIFGVVIIFLYAITANVCYTGGWSVELISRKLWPQRTHGYAVWTLSLGVALSVLTTLAPGLLIAIDGLARLWSHYHRVGAAS